MRAMLLTAFSLTLYTSACAPTTESKVVAIPLKDVWAIDMPGTRDIRLLEPEIFQDIGKRPGEEGFALLDKSLRRRFEKTLTLLPQVAKTAENPGKSFAVEGDGREALENAVQVRSGTMDVPTVLSMDKPVTIVFFSHEGNRLALSNVSLQDTRVRVSYRFPPHMTMDIVPQIALIPLGKLPEGEYQVDIECEDQQPGARNVCKPFSFAVGR